MAEHHVSGQLNRQILRWHRNSTAGIAVNDRNGSAPIPLPRNQPRANLPVDRLVPVFGPLQRLTNGVFREVPVKSVKALKRRVHHVTKIGLCCLHGPIRRVTLVHDQHPLDGDVVGLGEVKITLIMSRDSHDGPGPVRGDNKVSEPDGQVFTCQRVRSISAREHTLLLVHVLDAIEFGHACHFVVKCLPFGFVRCPFDQRQGQRVLWSQRNKR